MKASITDDAALLLRDIAARGAQNSTKALGWVRWSSAFEELMRLKLIKSVQCGTVLTKLGESWL